MNIKKKIANIHFIIQETDFFYNACSGYQFFAFVFFGCTR